VPLVLPGTSQLALLVAFQEQPLLVVSPTEPVPPLEATLAVDFDSE
jgi:hypothetical protein